MGRSRSSSSKAELKKGPWTREEDQKLMAYIELHGHGSWRTLPAKAGLQRYGKSCRLRWTNYLRPDIKRGKFSTHEEKTIIRLHALMGNRWSAIAAYLPKRTDNEIKNYWNTRLKKRLTRMGIDPSTHKPKNGSALTKQAAHLNHMAQWETARLEAEARLARESKLLHNIPHFATMKPYSTTTAPPRKVPEQPQFLDVLRVWQATDHNRFFSCGSSAFESPTSTLNFSSSSTSFTSPAVTENCNHHENSVEGKMENIFKVSDQENNNSAANTYGGICDVTGLLDSVLVNTQHADSAYYEGCNENNSYHDNVGVSDDFFGGDLGDTMTYWNELLNMVKTPLESPLF